MANVQIKQEELDVEIKKRDSEEEQKPENESDRQTGETIEVVLPRWIALKEVKPESVAENPAEKIAIPALTTTAYTAKQPKKRKTESSKREAKRECDRKRSKSRIYIGEAFQRWRELRDCVGFTLDSELALLLLDIYDRYAQDASVSTTVSRPKSERDDFSDGCQEADVKQESFVSVDADDDSEHTEDSEEDQINGSMNSDCRRPQSDIPDVQRVTGGAGLRSDRGSQRRKRPEGPEKPGLIPPVCSEEGLDQT